MIKYTVIFLLLFTIAGYPHSGRTDKYGGHTNRKTGEYHYHNKKTPSDNSDIDCDKSPQNNYKKNNKSNNQGIIKSNSQDK